MGQRTQFGIGTYCTAPINWDLAALARNLNNVAGASSAHFVSLKAPLGNLKKKMPQV